MNRFLSSAVCATAVLLSAVSVDAVMATASAQVDMSLNFDTFHDQLASYGDWVYSDRWGEVWIPANVPDDFHPYGTAGHWAYTNDYGWTWASDYEWGDIPFHYGRWVNDPDNGWLWIPGYVWSPGWVVWRSNGEYTGWMPMPPDDAFLSGGGNGGASFDAGGVGISIDFNNTGDYYGYGRWYGGGYDQNAFAANWVFVGTAHMADPDYVRFVAPRGNYITIIQNTRNVTNYTIVNNFVVNKSVDVHVVEKASGHPIVAIAATAVFKKPQFIMRADTGRRVQMQMRQEMPRGTGLAGSAPKPSTKVVQSLSTNVAVHNGKQPAHLYTRDTVAKAPLPARAGGPAPNAGGPGNTPPNGSTDDMKRGEHRPADVNPPPTPPSDNTRTDRDNRSAPNDTTTPPGDETRRGEHRPADVNPPPTPPSDNTRTDRDNRTSPNGTTPPDHRDRTATPPANTPPPATPPDDQKKDKDKKPKPGDTPPPQ